MKYVHIDPRWWWGGHAETKTSSLGSHPSPGAGVFLKESRTSWKQGADWTSHLYGGWESGGLLLGGSWTQLVPRKQAKNGQKWLFFEYFVFSPPIFG